jgi:hypothetical protein
MFVARGTGTPQLVVCGTADGTMRPSSVCVCSRRPCARRQGGSESLGIRCQIPPALDANLIAEREGSRVHVR